MTSQPAAMLCQYCSLTPIYIFFFSSTFRFLDKKLLPLTMNTTQAIFSIRLRYELLEQTGARGHPGPGQRGEVSLTALVFSLG